MANNILVKDANGVTREVKTQESNGVHTPVHKAEGALTNAELRATPIETFGTLTDTQLRATPINVEVKATVQTPVTGPLTDAQLRATAVPVSAPANAPLNVVGAVSVSAGTVITAIPINRVPITYGKYQVNVGTASPLAAGLSLTPPVGAVGVRLFIEDENICFNLGAPPQRKVADGIPYTGGIVFVGERRELSWAAGSVSSLQLTSESTNGSGVWVEFLKQGT